MPTSLYEDGQLTSPQSPPEKATDAKLRENPAALLQIMGPHRKSSTWRALFQLIVTLGLFSVCWIAMTYGLNNGYPLMLLLLPIAAGLLVRVFIFQHDCGHRSFFHSTKANDVVGSFLALLTMTPYHMWRRFHAIHHATSGDLDRRGRGGEIWVMTVREYEAASASDRRKYRWYRSPWILLGVGPIYQFMIQQRFTTGMPKTWKRERLNVHLTNLGILVFYGLLIALVGWKTFAIVHLPTVILAGTAGVWLFYVQHQFEDAYYHEKENWNYAQAALEGSSYYRLPKILQWFSGNIGLHHIHHLDSGIPNYSLEEVQQTYPELKAGSEVTLWESLKCLSYKLWDEDLGKMVPFPKHPVTVAAAKQNQKAAVRVDAPMPVSSLAAASERVSRVKKTDEEPVEAA